MTKEFYRRVATRHRLFYADWPAAVRREGQWLDELLRPFGTRTVLDCTCGIGTQALGLAELGYQVTGSDFSVENLAEAQQGATEFAVNVTWCQADVRQLDLSIVDQFDAVIALGNSLSHLLNEVDLAQALRQMVSRTKLGGLILVGQRDWDEVMRRRPRFHFRHEHLDTPEPGQRTILFDLWHYQDPLVTFEVFFLHESRNGWQVEARPLRYRMWQRRELIDLLEDAGLEQIREVEHPWEMRLVGRRN